METMALTSTVYIRNSACTRIKTAENFIRMEPLTAFIKRKHQIYTIKIKRKSKPMLAKQKPTKQVCLEEFKNLFSG